MKTIPPWLRKIIDETDTPEACKKAVWRVVKSEWDATHPRKLKKRGTKALTLAQMHMAVDKVLCELGPIKRRIPFPSFLKKVQIALGDSPTRKRDGTRGLYGDGEVAAAFKTYMVKVYWHNPPMHLYKRREELVNIPPRPDDL